MAAPRAGRASSSPRACREGGSALIFVLIIRNLKDFVILHAPCQAFLSWQRAERQPVGMMNRRRLSLSSPAAPLTLC